MNKTKKKKIPEINLGTYYEDDFPTCDAMCAKIEKDAIKKIRNPK